MKKRIWFSLILFFLCIFLRGYAQTDENVPVAFGDWTYIRNKRGITLTNYIGTEENLWIPYELDGKAVTAIGSGAFKGNSTLRSVIISGSVTSIGSYAFEGCVNLEEVRLGYDMSRIEDGVFRDCHKLKSIYIPKKVTAIGSYTFTNCFELREAYFSSVRTIGESAFENCYALTTVVYGNRLTTVGSFAFRNTAWADNMQSEFVFIGKGILLEWHGTGTEVTVPIGTVKIAGAFDGNDRIEKITLPETVLEIGKYAFRNAVNLKNINIPQYVTKIDSNAFEGCRSLQAVVLPKRLKSIGSSAFRGCESLAEMTVTPYVTQLGSMVFADCISLRSVTIPETVTKIDGKAFLRSDAVVLHVEPDSVGDLFGKEHDIPCQYPLYETKGILYYRGEDGIHIAGYSGAHTIVKIPQKIEGKTVTAIDAGAFQNVSCVRRILLPASVKSIGSWAFSYMDALEYVVIPAGLKSMGSNVFTGSSSLREIQLPKRLKEIGENVFDPETETVICSGEGSYAMLTLTGMGYTVEPYDFCTVPTEPYLSADECPSELSAGSTSAAETREILQIPDGLKTLSADLIRNAGSDLVLFIPESIEEIDDSILEGRNLTIVGYIGTSAEGFAREHGIPFLVRNLP